MMNTFYPSPDYTGLLPLKEFIILIDYHIKNIIQWKTTWKKKKLKFIFKKIIALFCFFLLEKSCMCAFFSQFWSNLFIHPCGIRMTKSRLITNNEGILNRVVNLKNITLKKNNVNIFSGYTSNKKIQFFLKIRAKLHWKKKAICTLIFPFFSQNEDFHLGPNSII